MILRVSVIRFGRSLFLKFIFPKENDKISCLLARAASFNSPPPPFSSVARIFCRHWANESKTICLRFNAFFPAHFASSFFNSFLLYVFRRMFPVPDFYLAGLEPDQYYGCSVEVIAVDSNRYRYKMDQGWIPAGKGIQLDQAHCKYLHPNSASLGQYWMVQGATFDKLKLSNHILPSSENVSDLPFINSIKFLFALSTSYELIDFFWTDSSSKAFAQKFCLRKRVSDCAEKKVILK